MLTAAKALAFSVLHSVSIISSIYYPFILQQAQILPHIIAEGRTTYPSSSHSYASRLQNSNEYCRPLMYPLRGNTWENAGCRLECISSSTAPKGTRHQKDANQETQGPFGSSHISTHSWTPITAARAVRFPSQHQTPLLLPQPFDKGQHQLLYDTLICTSSTLLLSNKAHEIHRQKIVSNSRVDLGEIDSMTSQYSTVVFRGFGDLTVVARGRSAKSQEKSWKFLEVERMTFIRTAADEASSYHHPYYTPYDQALFVPEHSMVIENTKVTFARRASLILHSLQMTNVTVEGFAFGFAQNIRIMTFQNTHFVNVGCTVVSLPNVKPVDNADVTITDSSIGELTQCYNQQLLQMNSLAFLNVTITALNFQAFSSLTLAHLEFNNCHISDIKQHAFRGVIVRKAFVFIFNTIQRMSGRAFYELVTVNEDIIASHHRPVKQSSIEVHGNSFTCDCGMLHGFQSAAISAQLPWANSARSPSALLLKSSTCMDLVSENHKTTTALTAAKPSPQSFLCSSCPMTTDEKQRFQCDELKHNPLPAEKSPEGKAYTMNERLCSCLVPDSSQKSISKKGQFIAIKPGDEATVAPKLCKDGQHHQGQVVSFELYQQHHCQSRSSSALAITLPILAVLLVVGVLAGAVYYMKYTKRGKRRRQSTKTVVVSLEDAAGADDEHYANADSLLNQSTRQYTSQQPTARPESSLANIHERIQEDEERYETVLHQTVAISCSSPFAEAGAAGRLDSKNDLYQYVDISTRKRNHLMHEYASVHESPVIYAVPADNNEESEGDYEEVVPTNRATESLAPAQADQEEVDPAWHPNYDVPHWTGTIPIIRQL